MYLSCKIFGRVCYTDLPLTTGRAGWAEWWRRGAPEWEREQEREDNTPASTKSNSKRYKIVAAAVTDTRRWRRQRCTIVLFLTIETTIHTRIILYYTLSITLSNRSNFCQSMNITPWRKRGARPYMRYEEVLMYTHKLYYVIIYTYIACDIIICIVVSSGAAVEEWMKSTGEWKNKRESQRVTKRWFEWTEREMDRQTDIERRLPIHYIIFF